MRRGTISNCKLQIANCNLRSARCSTNFQFSICNSRFAIALLAVLALVLVSLRVQAAPAPAESRSVILVVGAEGTPQYGQQFATWQERWAEAAGKTGANIHVVGRNTGQDGTDLERLGQLFDAEPKDGPGELWLVLIGHGTFDGRTARFNLRGLDVSDADLAKMIAPFRRPVVVINCSASSGPFVNRLSGPNRAVISATRSGSEENFTRFGEFLSGAIADPAADYDKDGQTSLLEAFLAASRRVAEFYRTESRLATEHALLDDNGDGLGTPADWFRGIRAVKKARDGTTHDGHRAHQIVLVRSEHERRIPPDSLAERNRLELSVAQLREQKSQLSEEAYYDQLEQLILDLARLQEESAPPR
jgi:hypothetical protein